MKNRKQVITFLRHWETIGNREDILMGGLMDFPLTSDWTVIAKSLAPYIKDMKFDVIYCSPNERAKTTMELSCSECTAPRIITESLREQSYGTMTGKKLSEVPSEVDSAYTENPYSFAHENWESMEDLMKRVGNFLKNEIFSSWYENILLVTHENVIRAAVGYLRGLTLETVNLRFTNCSLTQYKYTWEKYLPVFINKRFV